MTASYEKLIEELYKSDKSKLETALESDAKEILNDERMRSLLKEFILRLDKDSNFEPSSMTSIRYFELLKTIDNLQDFHRELEEVKSFGSRDHHLRKVVDESTLHRFVHRQKVKCYRNVDDSDEYNRFKEYLKNKYQSRRRH